MPKLSAAKSKPLFDNIMNENLLDFNIFSVYLSSVIINNDLEQGIRRRSFIWRNKYKLYV